VPEVVPVAGTRRKDVDSTPCAQSSAARRPRDEVRAVDAAQSSATQEPLDTGLTGDDQDMTDDWGAVIAT
jgi:hypothetical protein